MEIDFNSVSRRVEGLTHVGIFGSRVRGNNYIDSDLDLIFVGRSGTTDMSQISSEIAEIEKVPKADIYYINRESVEIVQPNPKVTTMSLEFKQLWMKEGETAIKPKFQDIDTGLFCCFLEFERLKNIKIFEEKEPTHDYIKKMPGGRRAFDEIFWLGRLVEERLGHKTEPHRFQEHLSIITLKSKTAALIRTEEPSELQIHTSKMMPHLDRHIFDLECMLAPNLSTVSGRGPNAVQALSKPIYRALTSTDPNELTDLYKAHIGNLSNQESWLVLYAVAFNSSIDAATASKIAKLDEPKLFDMEIKKQLLENRSIKDPKFREVLEVLTNDKSKLIRLYANIRISPEYLDTFKEPYKTYLKKNVNHIL